MAESLPTGAPTPEATPNQQETRAERRQRRRGLAREATARERAANPETRAQAAALQETDTAEVGSGLLGQIANFPIDLTKESLRLGWKMTKGTAKFTGRAAVGGVKYPAMAGGVAVLAGGGVGVLGAALLYKTGKVGWQHGSTTHKSKNFFDSMVKNFNLSWSEMGVGKKK